MSMQEIMNIQGIECYEKEGTAYLKLETVARGLGFTKTDVKVSETSFRKEYVRIDWPRVEKYLSEIGFSQEVAKDSFIPENIFYRLAMKAKNEVAERFQAKIADEVIPSIRKHGAYMTPETLEQAILNPDYLLQVVTALKTETDKRKALEVANSTLTVQNQIMQPKAEYFDLFGTTAENGPLPQVKKAPWHKGCTNWLSEVVERHVRAVTGVDGITSHDLRHVFSRLALTGGVSMELLQGELGHASMSTTQRYSGLLTAKRQMKAAGWVFAQRDREEKALEQLMMA